MFGLSRRFDIVLGNPPYIQLKNSYDQNSIYADLYKDQNHKNYADLYEDQEYKTFAREGDIYCLFYERGVELLRKGGLLAYITSNKWMRAGYGQKLREYFATDTNPLLRIDLGPTSCCCNARPIRIACVPSPTPTARRACATLCKLVLSIYP
jgi:hypothetical protein